MAKLTDIDDLFYPYGKAEIKDYHFYYKDCPTWDCNVKTFVVIWNKLLDKKDWVIHGWYDVTQRKFMFPFNPDVIPQEVQDVINEDFNVDFGPFDL